MPWNASENRKKRPENGPFLSLGLKREFAGSEILIKKSDRFDAAKIIFQGNVFVGGVSVFIRHAEAEEHARNLEGIVHLGDEGNRSAFADEDGFFAEAGFERMNGLLENRMRVRRYPGFAAAQHFELAGDRLGQEFADVLFDELGDSCRILIGHEPRGKFGPGFRGDHGLGAFALITAPYTIYIESGANPKAFDDGEPFLAAKVGSADRFAEFLFFPGKGVQEFALLGRNGSDVIIESRDRDAEVLVVEFRDCFRQD